MIDKTFKKIFKIKVNMKYIGRPLRKLKGQPGYFSLPLANRLPKRLIKKNVSFIECIEKSLDSADDQYAAQIEIRYLNKKLGYGVFARQDIEPGVIGIYAGELKKLDGLSTSRYLFSFTARLLKDVMIDGSKLGNWTIFMNHNSSQSRSTNVCVHEYFHKGLPYIVFCASKKIKKGRQLLYDYGESYWKSLEIEPEKF